MTDLHGWELADQLGQTRAGPMTAALGRKLTTVILVTARHDQLRPTAG